MALELARAGIAAPDALRFMRGALGLREFPELPGVMAYGATEQAAIAALALRRMRLP